jgi:hypothetical protein
MLACGSVDDAFNNHNGPLLRLHEHSGTTDTKVKMSIYTA